MTKPIEGEPKRAMAMRKPKAEGVYRRPDSDELWITYTINGRRFRESAKTTKVKVAEEKRRERLGEYQETGAVGKDVDRVMVGELFELLAANYQKKKRSSLVDVEARWRLHLQPFFGVFRAVQVSTAALDDYVAERQEEGAEDPTINREIAAMRRMFRLGKKAKKVSTVPDFEMLPESDPRCGFINHATFQRLIEGATLHFRAIAECGYTYGWRRSELTGSTRHPDRKLRVGQVDFDTNTVRLERGMTKNKQPRVVPLTAQVRLLFLELARGKEPDAPLFTRPKGDAVADFRCEWRKATAQAGCAGLLFHDLRRTAARNMRNAGVPESVIMEIGGWVGASMFRRYAIVNTKDMEVALTRVTTFLGSDGSHVSVTLPALEDQELDSTTQNQITKSYAQ